MTRIGSPHTQEHDEDKEMSSECKAEVKRDEIRAAEDYRLNYRLNKACDAEIDDMCADVCSPFQGQACGGTVIKCLTEKEENITNTDCRNELFGVEKKEGKDWRNDAVRATCSEDEPGVSVAVARVVAVCATER